MSRTVIPSLTDDVNVSSSSDHSVGKALEQAYKWLDYCGRFAVYVEERSRRGESLCVLMFHFRFCASYANSLIVAVNTLLNKWRK